VRIAGKITTAFYVTAAFLLVVGITAIWLIGQLNAVMKTIDLAHEQLDRVAATRAGFHNGTDKVEFHRARLRDLTAWASTARERDLLTEAETALAASPPDLPRALKAVDELDAYYRGIGAAGQQRLEVLHRRAVTVMILVVVDGVLLAVILLFLVRQWLVRPVVALEAAAAQIAAGQPVLVPVANGRDEISDLARHLNALVPVLTELRERLAKAERLAQIGESATFVAHNLSEPLRSIRALAQYEHDASSTPPDAKAAFQHIIFMTKKLEQWITDMGSTIRSPEPLLGHHALEPILHDATSLLRPLAAERAVTLAVQCDEAIPALNIDRAQIEQALVALLTNAIEASPEGGQVTLAATATGATVEVRIRDQGRGMTDETKRKALLPFFTTKRGSPGLGLTVAERIARCHQGALHIASAQQQGTTVCLTLPVAGPERRSPPV